MATVSEPSSLERVGELLDSPEGRDLTAAEVAERLDLHPGHASRLMKQWRERAIPPVMVPVESIHIDSATQARPAIVIDVVEDYKEHLLAGGTFPPLDLYADDDGTYWPGDGTHRALAYRGAGLREVPAVVRPGGKDAAIRHALHANAEHGMRRDRATKRRAIEMAMALEPGRTAGYYAETCRVSRSFAESVLKAHVESNQGGEPEARVGRDGKHYPAPRRRPEPEREPQAAEDGEMPGAESVGGNSNCPADDPLAECPLSAQLTGISRGVFERDARLYFDLLPLKDELGRLLKRAERGKEVGEPMGPYTALLSALLRQKHPVDWKAVSPDIADPHKRLIGFILP